MDFRTLRYFVEVAEHRSFTKAAVHLRIAQPALSRQVRKLEEELGVRLLIRAGRGLELTDAGQNLLPQAHHILDQVRDIGSSVRAKGNQISGSITLGVSPAAGEYLVPALIEDARILYPDLRIDVVEALSGLLYEYVLTHRTAISVMYNPAAHRELDILPLAVEEMCLVGPGSPRKGLLPADKVADIGAVQLILPPWPHSLRSLIERAFDERQIQLNICNQVEGSALIRTMVGAGLGYSILTYASVKHEVEAGRLSARPLTAPPISWRLCQVRRRELNASDAVEALSQLLIKHSRTLFD